MPTDVHDPPRRDATTNQRPARVVGTPHGSARCTLTINGTAYVFRGVPCDREGALTCFSIWRASPPGKPPHDTYIVSLHQYGSECTCPDFTFHREGRDAEGCKHVRSLVALGFLPRAQAARPAAPEGGPDPFPRRVRDGRSSLPGPRYDERTNSPGHDTSRGGHPA